MAIANDIYTYIITSSRKEKNPHFAASDAVMIMYLFIEPNPNRDSSWQSFLPARGLGRTIWPL